MDGGQITGTVAAIVFQNNDNGYAVLRLDTEDGVVTAAGCIPGVQPGEKLRLSGSWTTHQSYGEQFKTESFEPIAPTGADEIYRYLASGAIKGVGPKKALDIVEKFGDAALGIIENEPDKLAEVKGITIINARQIGSSFRNQAGLRRLIDFLSPYGIKPIVATRVYRDYGNISLSAVKDNPYILAGEPYGAEFSESDRLAFGLGFESDCPERVSAAVLFELEHNLQNGHVFIPRDKLIYATCELISVPQEAVEDALDMLSEEGDIVLDSVAGAEACYLRHMFESELYIAQRITEMSQPVAAPAGLRGLIADIETEQGITYAQAQLEALELAARHPVMALTGGPGTGKTTTVRGILALFDALGLKTALCAPTGRAAKRLGELCHREAATIHRLLGTSPGEGGVLVFSHDELNPLKADAVIVDETSMVDIPLMRALLAALKQDCRIVMVGDADQLPPVGPGSVFADVIRSESVPVVALTEIFRQARDSGIVKNAHLVNKGVVPELGEKCADFFFLRRQSEEQIAETVAELFGERLPKNMGIDPSQIQVLSPTRRQTSGTAALNERLREAVNPRSDVKKEKQYGDFLFRVGDKVMQIRNNYDIIWKNPAGAGVFNGDIGMITDIDLHRETLTVDFEDKLVVYQFEQLAELEPAFAMTVHKSQGSEYNAVILAVTSGAPQLLTRSILYTAMTRARSLLIMVGDPGVMARMVANDKKQRRYSGLKARLGGTLQGG